MEWYASFFAEVSDIFDMVPLVVLSNPSSDVLKAPSDERLDLWKQYISIVVEAVGLNCKHYQLLNEPNNPVYRIFSRRDTAIAIQGAASIIRERVAGARLSINVIVELVGWKKAVTELLLAAPRCIDIVGLDLYPDTWRIGMKGGFDDLWDLQQSWAAVRMGLAFHRALPELKTTAKGRGRTKHRPGYNLLERLRKFKTETLRFLTDFDVPFTNNLAEQDLRMMKISGSFRTLEGAQIFALLRSVVSTARKQGFNILQILTATPEELMQSLAV